MTTIKFGCFADHSLSERNLLKLAQPVELQGIRRNIRVRTDADHGVVHNDRSKVDASVRFDLLPVEIRPVGDLIWKNFDVPYVSLTWER